MATQDWGQDDAWGHREFGVQANMPPGEIYRRLQQVERRRQNRNFLADLLALVVFCTLLWLAIEVLT